MKIAYAIAVLAAVPAFAGEISLSPGSSVTINAGETTLISCQGSADNSLPLCTIEQDYNGEFHLEIGANTVGNFGTFEGAINAAKDAKEAGLCK